MKKRIFAALCVCTMLLGLLAGCGSPSVGDNTGSADTGASSGVETGAPGENEWQSLLGTQGKIRVGISPDYPPFESYATDDSGNVTAEVVGFDVEMANYIGEYLGLEVELVPMAFETIISAVNAGTIDLGCSCFSYREDRDVLFSDTYYTSCQAVVVATAGSIRTLDDLAGQVILAGDATTGMYYAEELCAEYGCEVRSGDIQPMMENLKALACAAIVTEECVAQSYINANPGLFEIINQGASEDIKVIAKNGNEDLMEKVNEAVNSFINSDGYDALVESYFG